MTEVRKGYAIEKDGKVLGLLYQLRQVGDTLEASGTIGFIFDPQLTYHETLPYVFSKETLLKPFPYGVDDGRPHYEGYIYESGKLFVDAARLRVENLILKKYSDNKESERS